MRVQLQSSQVGLRDAHKVRQTCQRMEHAWFGLFFRFVLLLVCHLFGLTYHFKVLVQRVVVGTQ